MKKFVLSSIAVIIICACSTTTKKYSIKDNHYEDLKYGFSLDLPNRKFWKIYTKWPERLVNSSTVSQKRFRDSGRLVMVSKTSFGIIIISAKSMGQLMISAVEECDKFKLLLLEIRKEYSSEFEDKAWVSEDWHLLSGNDCLVNFEFIENDIRVLATSYFKVYRKNDNVLFNIILVSNSKNFVANYLTFADLVLSLTINTPDGQSEVERTFEVTKEISPIDEMNNLMAEMPEMVSLKEGLPAYYVHVYTPDMPIWDNKIEAQKLLGDLRKVIDPNVQLNSRPYGRSVKYTVYYGPYSSKLKAARMAKKIKNAGYSFYIKLTPNA